MRQAIAAAIILASITPAAHAETDETRAASLCIVSHSMLAVGFPKNANASASSIVSDAISECRNEYVIPDPSPYLRGFYDGAVQGYRAGIIPKDAP
jgi:hypothetical protein